ncbi:MAG: tetratricopeptide repeat protein [Anaeromyxobacter sp.]
MSLAPDNPRAQNDLGIAYRMQDRLSDAEAAFRKAVEMEPTFNRCRNVGLVLLEQARYPEARQMFEKALSIKPQDDRSYGFLGRLYTLGGEKSKAAECYRKAISLIEPLLKASPSDVYLLSDMGSYYAGLGDSARSQPLLQRAAALAELYPEVLYNTAVALEVIRQRDEAFAALEKSLTAGMPAGFLERNPQLSALRADSATGQ